MDINLNARDGASGVFSRLRQNAGHLQSTLGEMQNCLERFGQLSEGSRHFERHRDWVREQYQTLRQLRAEHQSALVRQSARQARVLLRREEMRSQINASRRAYNRTGSEESRQRLSQLLNRQARYNQLLNEESARNRERVT